MERVVVSTPKSGRTWFRLFMQVYADLAKIEVPDIVWAHDDWGKPDKRIILLRDERDLLVSYYFQTTIRQAKHKRLDISMSEFIRHPEFGLPAINEFIERWMRYPGDQMVIRYEDLFEPIWELILEYFEIPIKRDCIAEADETCKFDNIKNNLWGFNKLRDNWRYLAMEDGRPTMNPKNPEAHKFRRGKVGGYVDYLNEDDINYINQERIG